MTPSHASISNSNSDEILLTRSGYVTTIRLNAPHRRNSFTDTFMESLLTAVETAVSDRASRVIIVTGGAQMFSVGGDLDEFASGVFAPNHLTVPEAAAGLRRFARATELLRSSDQISIAAIAGPCAGAGLSLAAACDIRIAAADAVFRTAFVDAGLASDYGGIWLVTRLIGEARAKELFLLNPKISAQQALGMGLTTQIVEADELLPTVSATAEQLAAKAPQAIATIKRLFSTAPGDLGAALDEESLAQKQCAYTEDAREAADAFLARRAPKFRGE